MAIAINYVIDNRKFSLFMCINGTLTVMVSMCSSCNAVEDWAAVVIGFVAGPTFMAGSSILFRFGVDDPLDAVAVHLGGGLWGILAAPVFHTEKGILHNWNPLAFQHFVWNFIGALAINVWTAALCGPMFCGLKLFGVLRVTTEVEERGLDVECQGEVAYPKSGNDAFTTSSVKPPNPKISPQSNFYLCYLETST